jgi:hypothetical protein
MPRLVVLLVAVTLGAHAAWAEEAPPATGSILVVTRGALDRVLLDGVALPGPPFQADDLAPGDHHLRVERPGREPLERDVTLAPAATLVIDIVVDEPPPPPEVQPLPAPAPAGPPAYQRVLGLLPWTAPLVLATVGTFVLAAFLWAMEPTDLPGGREVGVRVGDRPWQALRVTSLVLALATTGVTVLVLAWPTALGNSAWEAAREALGVHP